MTVSDRLRPSASTYEAWNLLFGLVALYSPSLLLPPLTPAFFIPLIDQKFPHTFFTT